MWQKKDEGRALELMLICLASIPAACRSLAQDTTKPEWEGLKSMYGNEQRE